MMQRYIMQKNFSINGQGKLQKGVNGDRPMIGYPQYVATVQNQCKMQLANDVIVDLTAFHAGVV